MGERQENPEPAGVPHETRQAESGMGGAEEETRLTERPAADRRPAQTRLKESVKLVLEVAVLALVIYVFIFQISIVKGQSMAPSFAEEDRLVIDKLTYRFVDVRRFDVIVFSVPGAKHKDYIKRVIGLPGETVELRGGALYIDGARLAQDFSFRGQLGQSFGPTRPLRESHYFVLGDNRPSSTDSRLPVPGPVPLENIRGRVRVRVWPPGRLGLF